MEWSHLLNRCVTPFVCGEGLLRCPNQDTCVDDYFNCCLAGTVWDEEKFDCVDLPTCPDGKVICPGTTDCVDEYKDCCVAPNVWCPSSKQCIDKTKG